MTPALDIQNLNFRYARRHGDALPDGAVTLCVGSLRLDRAEQLLLTGSSGSGKSTLLNLIAGVLELRPPNTGSIRVNGEDVHALRPGVRDRFRGRHIGMIFQTFNLLSGFSALENVLAALMFSDVPAREHEGRARSLLDRLGVRDVHREPDELSVGQQQRVAVARALACRPVLVLADEPTASLDPENVAGAIELVQAACRETGAALLCVSHDPSLAARFERRVSVRELAAGGGGVDMPFAAVQS